MQRAEKETRAKACLLLGIVLLPLALAHPVWAAPEPPRKVASYELRASLDAEKHAVSGRGTITWTNPSSQPANKLFFHLYLNAFENEQTLFLREGGGRHGGLSGRHGFIRVDSLTSPRFDGVELWDHAAPHSPNDERDRTDISVALPEPVGAGETLTLHVEFTSQLPEIIERTGYHDDFHLVAQWFPKIAKREPNGEWAHFAFHPYAEFYANFGNYDVEIDVPADHVVGSTGRLQRIAQDGERTRYRSIARGVHDFAWTSWPDFHRQTRVIDAIEVHVLSPPGTFLTRSAIWRTLRTALPHFQRSYGSYPYPTLTVVQPPRAARRAGGMEYPTFITVGGSDAFVALGIRATEIVTVHELGHQWFQGILASNEAAHPFLDEGINSYAEWRYMTHEYGDASLVDLGTLDIGLVQAERALALDLDGDPVPISQPAAAFESFRSLARHVYAKTALSLETLGRVYGQDELHDALRTYAESQRFRHPEPTDLLEHLKRHLGAEAATAARQMLLEPAKIDLLVREVSQGGGLSGPSKVVVERRGNVALPFEVLARDEAGKTKTHLCSATQTTCTFRTTSLDRVVRVVVDPEQKVLLDDNLQNNRHVEGPSTDDSLTQWTVSTLWQFFLHLLAP